MYSRCQLLCGFVLTCSKQFIKKNSGHKSLLTALNKTHASRELLSFRISFTKIIKKNVEHAQNKRVKKTRPTKKFVKKIKKQMLYFWGHAFMMSTRKGLGGLETCDAFSDFIIVFKQYELLSKRSF